MKPSISVMWFINDLRVNDHEGLAKALNSGYPVVGVYVWTPLLDSITPHGFPKVGSFRRHFIMESLLSLRKELARFNIPLLLFLDTVESAFYRIQEEFDIRYLIHQVELGSEEKTMIAAMRTACSHSLMDTYHGKSLYHPDDLPFDIQQLPSQFTQFRHLIEQKASSRALIRITRQEPLSWQGSDDTHRIDKLVQGNKHPTLRGGCDVAQQRLHYYLFTTRLVSRYKETRNGMLAMDDSSKLSPYLALGCISPREVDAALRHYEHTIEQNESTYWLYFELLWRDYFHFVHYRFGNRLFALGGLTQQVMHIHTNSKFIQAWLTGSTGYPLVDAAMIELRSTGWMSNRGRQNVANFFCKYLHQDWRIGAAWFESQLIDYDVSSNYGNWTYQAGNGTDPRENRLFDVIWQGQQYDPSTEYLLKWLPILSKVPMKERYRIPLINASELHRLGIIIGNDYPSPIVQPPLFKRSLKP